MPRALLALGSNLGDRDAQLEAAVTAIGDLSSTTTLAQSTWHTTRPVGGPPEQGEFLNGALLIDTGLEPADLRGELQRIERDLGRKRADRWAARTLDIDILLYDDRVIDDPDLEIPHPRMSFRPFVLAPASEIASDMVHPVLGVSIGNLWDHLQHADDKIVIGGSAVAECQKLAENLLKKFGSDPINGPIVFQSRWLDQPILRIVDGVLIREPLGNFNPKGHRPKLQIYLSAAERTPSAGALPIAGIPTLALDFRDDANQTLVEAAAAMEAVWPDLCRNSP